MAKPKKVSPRVSAERARQALQSRNATIIRGLTPERLLRALEEFDMGYLRTAAQLWQKIKDRDDTALPVSEKRELDCALLEYEILQVDDSPEAEQDKQALEGAYNGLVATDALVQDKRGGVSLLVRQMMHCVGHKYATHEIVWDPSGDDLTAEFRFTPLQFFEATTGKLRFLPTEGAALGEELEDGGWMVTVGPGLMEATSIAALFKSLPLKAWLVFCDKAGMPGLHGATDAQPGSKEWEKFRDAIASYGEDWALITSLAAKITPIDLKQGGQLPHPLLVDRMDRAITRIWRGADLGTMSKDGSAVGANPQESETEIFAAADAQLVSETLNHYFDRWVIRYRFGREPRAYFKLKPRVKVDQALQLKIDEALIKWGVAIGKNDLRERYGRAEPDAGEELAAAPATPVGGPDSGSQPSGSADPLANERAARAGRDHLFKLKAQADELAAKRPVYRPIAGHLAAMLAAPDAASMAHATERFGIESPHLYREVLRQAPELAKPAQEAIGTALVSGFAEHAAAQRGVALANSPRTGSYHDLRDELGRFAPEGGGDPDPAKNEALGRHALDIAARRTGDVKSAMYREAIGAIDFEQGTPGEKANDYKGGHGLTHIAAKHPAALKDVPTIVAHGSVKSHPSDPSKFLIEHPLGLVAIARRTGRRGGLITSYDPR